ncbi:MAG: TusE/DsrC/DsvC family sulfur relay protein [Bacteroidales bacterium]|nr:TusE/DsrC/DsvC family sulfur relay protein [Bacteroidales bacterium]
MAQIEFDGDGFLVNPGIWNVDIAVEIAKEDGIQNLTEQHWSVIHVIRNNYLEKGMAPMIRVICKETNLKLREIYELFPLGPARGACRIAGLPKPDGCV